MSRHNRRRTRGGHKASVQAYPEPEPSFTISPTTASPYSSAIRPPILLSLPLNSQQRSNDLTARHWHNRFIAWKARERRQKEEEKKLEAERRRIFGGEADAPDDDGWLCGRMMEVFDGLDYMRDG
ncbi:MAG: hypothetical protein FRX48_04256 [Lasallia pustulata]|uniref:Uncharacterized protein n=1 Tax=Lasallia pustulata TaxID=136370 RepID=A0A1W5D5Q6_9LECA|nr:MAG: hypothetical protein FRX48_04256 [Lasallia pustulata]SLM38239.1 hypothetical protein LPUS_08392 [Lasallia pustulata]